MSPTNMNLLEYIFSDPVTQLIIPTFISYIDMNNFNTTFCKDIQYITLIMYS